MTGKSEDSDSVYSRETSQVRSSLTSSSVTSPSSSEVILGGESISARRLSPQSTIFGTSGAWSLQQENMKGRPSRDGGKQSRQMRSRNATMSPEVAEDGDQDKSAAELISEMFTSVNSGLQVKFPESPEIIQSKREPASRLPRIKLHQAAKSSKSHTEVPPHASHFGLSQDINPTLLASGLLSTPPRKKRAELQSKFSTSPDARSSSTRHAKIVKSKASQGRLRKVSMPKKEQQATPSDSSVRGRLKPQSSIQGLKKLVGLTPGAMRSKSSIATKPEEFPDSLRLVIETHAMQETDKIASALKDHKKAAVNFDSGRMSPLMERERSPLPILEEDEVLACKRLPPRPSISGGNAEGQSFWRKIRSSTKPRESNETIRATSRCESRSTRRGDDEEDEGVNIDSRRSRWWNRIRDNAAKIVGQRDAPDAQYSMMTGTLPRPSMAPNDGRRKASLDAAMALADCLVDESEGPSQVEKDLVMRLSSSKRKKRPPMPLLLLQGREEEEDGIERIRPATSFAMRQETFGDRDGPLSAPLISQTAKERSGSKKNWLRPLQLTANLRSNGKLDNAGPNGKGTQRMGKQSDSCLLQKTLAGGAKVGASPPRTRLSVPALSSIKYKDTLPIPPRSRQSRASTISSMDSRTSIKEEGGNRDDYTQRTVGSSILYKDEEILRQQHHQYAQPPTLSLPPHPFPTSASTTSLRAKYMNPDDVTPREATDILYNLVSQFKNDGSPSTFRTVSAVTQTIASSRLTPLHLTPEAARYIRGRRTTCTTLESILTYQSSTDYSESSFQSQTVGSLKDDTKHDSHLQTLIDGVLEDIESLVSSSTKGSQGGMKGATTASSQHSRSVSDFSVGSAHSKFEWPPKSASQESGQLRLLGAKLFSSEIETTPLDSPCPPSRKKSLPLISIHQKKVQGKEDYRSVKKQIDFTHFKTDYVVGQARVPSPRDAFKQILAGPQQISPKTTMSSANQNETPSSTFLFSSQSPSIMGQSLVSTASSPPSILIQRPLSDTSLSNCSMTTSPDSVIISEAKVVCNRKSSASLMDLNDILQQKNETRSRSTSFASSIQREQNGQKRDAFEYDIPPSPDTSYSFTSSSQAWSEKRLAHYGSFEERRQSFGTECTDISPDSSMSRGHHHKQVPSNKYIPFAIEETEDEEEDRHREHQEYQEAMQTIEESQRYYPDSDYARQILSIFTPPKTLQEVINLLQESWEVFNLLEGKMPSLMTICIVERQRDQKRNKRKSIRLPRWQKTDEMTRKEQDQTQSETHQEEIEREEEMDNHFQDELLDDVPELCELDESSVWIPTTPSRWSSITATFDAASRYSYTSNDSNGRISFRYFVQSPSIESHSHSTHHHYLYR